MPADPKPPCRQRRAKEGSEPSSADGPQQLSDDFDRFRGLSRATGSIVWRADAKGEVHEATEWTTVTGQSAAEMQGWGWTEAVHPNDRDRIAQAWASALAGAKPYEAQFRLRSAAGEYRWHRDRGVPLFDLNGDVREWVGMCEDVHERTVAERERDCFFSAGMDMMVVAGLDGYFRRCSPKWSEVLGWSDEELTSRPWLDFVHPDDLERTSTEGARLGEGLETVEFENRYRAKDGSYRWISWRVKPFPEEGLIYGSASDITEKKQAEEALRQSEEQFRATFENAAVGIAHLGLDGRWLRLNDALCRIVGYSREELLTQMFGDVTHPDDLEAGWNQARDLIAGKIDSYSMQKRYIRKDGGTVWVTATVSLIRNSDGQPQHFLSIVQDISAQKAAEAALHESEDHFRFMVDSNPQVPWTADPGGNVTDLADRWLNQTGRGKDQFLGGGWSEIIHPDDLDRTGKAWERALRTGEVYDVEHRMRMSDGTYRWLRSRAVPRRDDEGRIIRWYGNTEDINTRKMVEQELERLVEERTAELELQLATTRAIADNADSALLLLDANGQITRTNLAFHRLSGFSEGEAHGATSHELLHWQRSNGTSYPENECPIHRAFLHGIPLLAHQDVFIRKSGETFPVVLSFTPIRDDEGTVTGGVMEFRDVTNEQEAERELRRREERYRSLAESIPMPLWTCGPTGTITFVNDLWRERYGLDLDLPSAVRWRKHFHPEDREGAQSEWARCLKTSTPYSYRCRLHVVGQGYRWHLCIATPQFAAGEVSEWIGTNVDVHDLTERQRALELTSQVGRTLAEDLDLERIVQALTDASVEASGAQFGAFFYTTENEAGEGLLLYTLSGAPKEAFERFGLPRATDLFGLTLRGEGTVRSGDIMKDTRYGRVGPHYGMPEGHLPVRSYLSVPVVSRSGQCIGALFLGHPEVDRFTEEHARLVSTFAAQAAVATDNARLYERQAKLNEELVTARDNALAASQAKSRFLANMSHEIRTPMNGVIGLTSLLEERSLDEQTRELIRTIAASGQTMLRVIDDILDFSKLDAGRVEIEPAPVDLAEIASDVVALYQGHANSKRVELRYQPPTTPAPRLMADSARVRQVLSNLVANALKFTERGHVELGYEWRATEDRVEVRLTVTDSGVGIPPERLGSIFESFTQADGSIQRKYGGTGLGLTISKALVELMGGTISVQSGMGRGTTFAVDLRLAAVLEPRKDQVQDDASVRPGLRVLVAEDNPVNVLVATCLLEQCGCQVEVAEDGLRAIAMVGEGDYDVVLMDVQMPYCDGLEATRTIREVESREGRRRLPIVALTANAMESDREECSGAGMDGFLAKPVTLDALRTILVPLGCLRAAS